MRVKTPRVGMTDSALAYSALRESGYRLRQFAEHVREVFWLTEIPPRGFLYLNPAFETVFGRSVDEIYDGGERWIECIHPDDAQEVRALWQTLDSRFEGWAVEFRIVRPDGEIRWVHERAFAITNASSTAFRVGGIVEDITSQKQQEAELSLYRSRLLELALELDDTSERERRRIAEGLHDDVGQNLALIRLQLGQLRQSLHEADREVVDQTAGLVQQTIHATRHLMFELSPPQLYELGYWAAVDWLA